MKRKCIILLLLIVFILTVYGQINERCKQSITQRDTKINLKIENRFNHRFTEDRFREIKYSSGYGIQLLSTEGKGLPQNINVDKNISSFRCFVSVLNADPHAYDFTLNLFFNYRIKQFVVDQKKQVMFYSFQLEPFSLVDIPISITFDSEELYDFNDVWFVLKKDEKKVLDPSKPLILNKLAICLNMLTNSDKSIDLERKKVGLDNYSSIDKEYANKDYDLEYLFINPRGQDKEIKQSRLIKGIVNQVIPLDLKLITAPGNYALLFFIDNTQVNLKGKDFIYCELAEGQQLTIEKDLKIDNPGTHLLYALLFPEPFKEKKYPFLISSDRVILDIGQ